LVQHSLRQIGATQWLIENWPESVAKLWLGQAAPGKASAGAILLIRPIPMEREAIKSPDVLIILHKNV
jgi:hypothetical protein